MFPIKGRQPASPQTHKKAKKESKERRNTGTVINRMFPMKGRQPVSPRPQKSEHILVL
jgi:hypothetical protein